MCGFDDENSEDLSYSNLDGFPDFLTPKGHNLMGLKLDHNAIHVLPRTIGRFSNLVKLDISNNGMTYIAEEIVGLKKLKTLIAKNNYFDDSTLPKDFGLMPALEVANFSGNHFTEFPMQFTEMSRLKCLYLGGNQIEHMPAEVQNMAMLEVFYMGGNYLTDIPAEIGNMRKLTSLVLCDNHIQTLPPTLIHLQRLKSLSLHNNQITTLPPQIVSLDLVELSLRNNPLVIKFVQELLFEPPSLLELAGRSVKANNLKYCVKDLPMNLLEYLNTARRCVNPKCKGVYFSSKVDQVKFVDFCGKYRLPLMQYLCTPGCTLSTPALCGSSSDSESEDETRCAIKRMKKVLLG